MRIVLTGAAGGIGRRVAKRLVDGGHDIVALDRNETGLNALPDVVDTRVVDLTDSDATAVALEGVAPDAVVTCAGWYALGALEDCPPDRFRDHLDANLGAVHSAVHPLLPTLRARKGRVVLVGSMVGSVPLPFHGGYSAAKAGLAGYADVLRRELAEHGVDVSLVEPGPTATGLNERAADSLVSTGERRSSARDDAEENPYATAYRAFDAYAPQAVAPERVAKRIVTATTTPDPRAKYRVSTRARWLPLLGVVLPTAVFDRIIRAGMPDGWLGRWIDR